MLACRIHAKEDLRVEAVDTPEVGPGQVLLRLGAGGICGSDIHYYFDGRNGSFVVREPLIPGHEASATVAAVGPGVSRVRVGDKVAVSPSHACGQCDYCREGREHLCRKMRFLGSASLFPHMQGMFSEFFVMGERQCYPVGGDVTLGELAFAEPLAVALHAVRRGTDLVGKSVLVTGAGTIGCLTVIAARLAGARSVTVSDILDRPLAQAREVGADRTLRADREADALAAPQFDVCYEVSGSFAALKSCVAAAKRGGVIVQVGTLPHEPLPFVVNELMAKELDLKGAFR
jgi:L-idonate 5-dehydrogenase